MSTSQRFVLGHKPSLCMYLGRAWQITACSLNLLQHSEFIKITGSQLSRPCNTLKQTPYATGLDTRTIYEVVSGLFFLIVSAFEMS